MQVALDNHILYALHGLVQEVRVRRVCEVNVSVLVRVPHKIPELASEKLLTRLNVSFAASVVGEVFSYGRSPRENLLSEQINLVKEEDEGGLFEILAVGDALKKHERFVHLVLMLVSCARSESF